MTEGRLNMREIEQTGRRGRRRLAVVAGVAITALLVVLAAASTIGTGNLGSFTPMGAKAIAALEPVQARLMEDCLNLEQAPALWKSALVEAGVPSDFIVSTDGGIQSKIGEFELVKRHLAKGCYMYAGVGNDASGKRVFYFAGPETLQEAEAFWAAQGN